MAGRLTIRPAERADAGAICATHDSRLEAHRAAGLFDVGVRPRHGRLDGEWKDCVIVERLPGPARVG